MSLYPSLHEITNNQPVKAGAIKPFDVPSQHVPIVPKYSLNTSQHLYPSLGDYMGLDLHDEFTKNDILDYTADIHEPAKSLASTIFPSSTDSLSLQSTSSTNGIRELILHKDKSKKIGLRVHAIHNGVFISVVSSSSPAANSGLRFGDQILEINGTSVAGHSMEQVHKLFNNSPNAIKVVVRDRPFERDISLQKDNSGQLGFQFKEGKIVAVVKDSSAAKNGMLTDHQILEINGKCVIGLKDKDLVHEIKNCQDTVTITVIPSYIFDHIVKNMAGSLLKLMTHSEPNV